MVDRVPYPEASDAKGPKEGQICIMIHTGSRGFAYQVCDQHVKGWIKVAHNHGIQLPDRQLAAVPIHSKEGQDYLSPMASEANLGH